MPRRRVSVPGEALILIPTSVKLVTRNSNKDSVRHLHFNPHEREARDTAKIRAAGHPVYFNPHEREARDMTFGRTSLAQRIF